MDKESPKEMHFESGQGGMFRSVMVKCTDCDFTVKSKLKFRGWKAVEGSITSRCRAHHLISGRNGPKAKDDKGHNAFNIQDPKTNEIIGGLAVSSEVFAQIYVLELALSHMQQTHPKLPEQ